MKNPELGHLLDETAQRDAIHVAIAPVVASELLQPGQAIDLVEPGSHRVRKSASGGIGIVDPFLPRAVQAEERFYVCLHQNTVTGMRHHWSHPAFCDEPRSDTGDDEYNRARDWLRGYAVCNCPHDAEVSADYAYRTFMDNINIDKRVFYSGSDLHSFAELNEPEELFRNLRIVLGREIDRNELTYECSC